MEMCGNGAHHVSQAQLRLKGEAQKTLALQETLTPVNEGRSGGGRENGAMAMATKAEVGVAARAGVARMHAKKVKQHTHSDNGGTGDSSVAETALERVALDRRREASAAVTVCTLHIQQLTGGLLYEGRAAPRSPPLL